MYKDKNISIVIPCYNEETQIEAVVNGLPDFIDKIIIIDDKSSDNTIQVIKELENNNRKYKAGPSNPSLSPHFRINLAKEFMRVDLPTPGIPVIPIR